MFELVLVGWVASGLLAFLVDFKVICKTLDEIYEEGEGLQTPGEERLGMLFLVCTYTLKGPFALYQALEAKYYGVHDDD